MPQISKTDCIELRSNPGFYLRSDAAKAWDRANAAFGKIVLISGAWRSLQTQVELFDSEKYPKTGRYVRGNRAGQRGYTSDVRGRLLDGSLYRGSWWTRKEGTAAAAVPGTSNHGGGIAVDALTARRPGDPGYDVAVIFAGWNDADRTRFLRVAAEHGWDDDEGRQVSEHWHLTYYPDRDQHRGEAVPAPPTKEEFLMALSDAKQEALSENARKTEIIVRRSEARQQEMVRDLRGLTATVNAQAAVIETLSKNAGLDPKAVSKLLSEGIASAMKNFELTLSPKE